MKLKAEDIAKALKESIESIAQDAVKKINDDAAGKEDGEDLAKKKKNAEDAAAKPAQTNVIVQISDESLAKAVDSILKAQGGDTDPDSEDDNIAKKKKTTELTEQQISDAVKKSASELGVDADDIQIIVKSKKKGAAVVDDDDSDDDEKFSGKDADSIEFGSDSFDKHYKELDPEQQEDLLDDFIGKTVETAIHKN